MEPSIEDLDTQGKWLLAMMLLYGTNMNDQTDAYNPTHLESRVRKLWHDRGMISNESKVKRYLFCPSYRLTGAGPHLADQQAYIFADVLARHFAMKKMSVTFPLCWNSFSPPAESAVQNYQSMLDWAESEVERHERILETLSYSHDYANSVEAADKNFYTWAQWLFNVLWNSWYDETTNCAKPMNDLPIPEEVAIKGEEEILKYKSTKRLVYKTILDVGYSHADKTCVGNEEIVENITTPGGKLVTRSALPVWMLRVSPYAERLYNGLNFVDAPKYIQSMHRTWIDKKKVADKVSYGLKDIVFSRMRAWGIPIAMMRPCDNYYSDNPTAMDVPTYELVNPPTVNSRSAAIYRSPWDSTYEWVRTTFGGKKHLRDSHCMPEWMTDVVAYIRLLDPNHEQAIATLEKQEGQFQNSRYICDRHMGARTLMYIRFFHKVLFDRGYVKTEEPFKHVSVVGNIFFSAPFTGYTRNGHPVSSERADQSCDQYPLDANQVTILNAAAPRPALANQTNIWVDARSAATIKWGGNIINLAALLKTYGADTIRMTVLNLGPIDSERIWTEEKIKAVHLALSQVFATIKGFIEKLIVSNGEGTWVRTDVAMTETHTLRLNMFVKRMTNALESMKFESVLDHIVTFVKHVKEEVLVPAEMINKFIVAISPFVPHVAEALWEQLMTHRELAKQPYPVVSKKFLESGSREMIVKLNLTKINNMIVPINTDFNEIRTRAVKLADHYLAGRTITEVTILPYREILITTTKEHPENL